MGTSPPPEGQHLGQGRGRGKHLLDRKPKVHKQDQGVTTPKDSSPINMHGYGKWEPTNKKEWGCFPSTVWERGYRADVTRERGLQGKGLHTSTGLPDAIRVLQPASRRSAPARRVGTGETLPHSQGCDSPLLHLSDTRSLHLH